MIAKGQIVEDKSSKDPRGRDKRNKNNNKNNNQNNRNQKRGQPEDDNQAVEDSSTTTKKQKLEGDASSRTISTEGVVAYSSATEPSDEDEDENMDPVKDAISSKDPSTMGKISLPADRQRPKRPCRYFMRGRCGKGDKCTYSHDPSLKVKR